MTDELQNTALLVSYDGRPYYGWQRLRDQRTVQGALEEAVIEVFGIESTVAGSGRTDRGAHAIGQVASTRIPLGIPEDEIIRSLNEELQEAEEGAIVIENAALVGDDFHALHSCTGKTYRYAMWIGEDLPASYERRVWHVRSELDLDSMAEAVTIFEGEHDFASFASKSNFDRHGTVRWLSQSSMFTSRLPDADGSGHVVEMVFTGNGFLYKMVRNLVRAVVRVGEGRSTVDDVVGMLRAKNRQAAPGSAPASGLYLDEAYYSPPVFQREDLGTSSEAPKA